MNKTDPRWNEIVITPSSGNVFLDLGFDPAEAEILQLRADVMIAIERAIDQRGWTQAETARHLGINQPRVSRLRKGVWKEFSLDSLLTLAVRIGLKPALHIA